jgi:8-oxo-dGTP pyrophosphatase MutT (NUDIX family)
MKKVSCGVLIYRIFEGDIEILLGHVTNQNRWDIFKGGIEPDESILDCALRELNQESSLVLQESELSSFLHYPEYTNKKELYVFIYNDQNNQIDASKLECTTYIPHLNNIPEFDSFSWVKLNDVPSHVAPALNKVINNVVEIRLGN